MRTNAHFHGGPWGGEQGVIEDLDVMAYAENTPVSIGEQVLHMINQTAVDGLLPTRILAIEGAS